MTPTTTPSRRWNLLLRIAASTLFLAAAANAQPTFTKAFSPSTIGPGSVSTLIFTINNASGSPVSDLAFTDVLPAGITIAAPAQAATTCSLGTVSAPDGGTTISLSGGGVGPNSTCFVTVDVTSSTVGTHMNVSGDLTSSAGNSGPATADLTVATNRPGFTKSFSPNPVNFGARSTLTFTIDNTANAALAGFLSFSDTLPAGLVVANPSAASTTCTNGVVTAFPGLGLIALSGNGTVNAGASCTVTVDVVANAVGLLGNTSGVLTSQVSSTNRTSGKAADVLDVTVGEVALTKSFTDDPVAPGGTVTLEFTIVNRDRNLDATNISFEDNLDATLSGLVATGLPMNDVCGAGSQLSGTSTLVLTGGNLPAQGSCTFSVTLQVPIGATSGAYPNTTTLESASVGGSPATVSGASDTLFIAPVPILTKSFTNDPVGPGGTVTLEFSITNTSTTSAASNIAFIDDLTAFLPFPISATLPAGGFCGAGSSIALISLGTERQALSVTGANLAAGASCTFSVDIVIPAGMPGGAFVNTTTDVTATVGGEAVTGNPASDTLVVVGGPRLEKEFIDDPVNAGDTVTLRFILTHDALAPADAINIRFSDPLGATLANLMPLGLPLLDVCGAGSLVQAMPTATDIAFTGGTLAPGASCQFDVTLQVPPMAPAGFHTNTTSNVMADVGGIATVTLGASDDLLVGALTLSKEFTNDPVLPGGQVTLQFTITNTSAASNATSIQFSDSLTSALSGLAAIGLPMANVCNGTGTLSGTTVLSFSGGTLGAGESCTFSVTLQVPAAAVPDTYLNVTSAFRASIDGSGLINFPNATDSLVVDDVILQLTKSFVDDPVAPGGTVMLQFNLTNLSATDAVNNIAFNDDLGAALAGLAPTGLPMPGCGGTVSAVGSTISLIGGSLAASGSCTFTVAVNVPVAAPAGTFINTTSSVTGTTNPGGLAVTGGPASDVLTVNAVAFSKSFSGPTTATGTVTLSFNLTNLSAGSGIADLAFSDDLGAVVTGLVATGLPMSDVCGTGSLLSGTSLLTLAGGNLAAAGSCTINVTLQVPPTATAGTFPNTSSDLFSSGLAVAPPATANLTIEPPPVLSKAFTPTSIAPGEASTMALLVDNTASALAANALAVTDNLPAGMVVNSPVNVVNTCGGMVTATAGAAVVSLAGGSVAAGMTCMLEVDVTSPTPSAVLVNTTGTLASSSGTSAAAGASLNVTAFVPPAFTKAFAPTAIAPGETSTMTLGIDNAGSALDATSLDVTDNLPAGMVVASPNGVVNGCGGTVTATPGTAVVSLTGGTVGAGASCMVQVVVTSAAASAVLMNTTGDLTSSLGSSGTASADLTVGAFVPPTFAKAFAPASILPGEVSTMTLGIDNAGSSLDATGLDVTDNLPAGMVVANPNGVVNTCGGSVTATPGAAVVSLTGGSVAAGASCMVQVDVTSVTTAVLMNTTGALTSSLGSSGTASATLNVGAAVPPTVSLGFAPNPVEQTFPATLTMTIDNSASLVPASALAVTANLPAGLAVAAPANATTTCGGTVTAAEGSNTVSLSGGTVAAGATCTVQADVVADVAGDYPVTTTDLTSSSGTSAPASDVLMVLANVLVIPTLGGWGLLVLGVLTALFGLRQVHRRR